MNLRTAVVWEFLTVLLPGMGLLSGIAGAANLEAELVPVEKQRVIVLTDISNEPDDEESLVRFLVYANEYDIEGLIATTSVWLKDTVRPERIQERVAAYGRVRDNLLYPRLKYIMEGDTPSFFSLINNGLGSHISPSYGGWGGRYVLHQAYGETRPIWTNARGSRDTVVAENGMSYTSDQATIWRWREAYQHDFAARMDWCAADTFEKANHNPVAAFQGDSSKAVVKMRAVSGQRVNLSAAGRKQGRHRGPKWHDGDFFKWLEAVAFVYATTRDEELDRQMDGKWADVREEIGFIPWYFDLPQPGYEQAWQQLLDPQGFKAPMGITTAERRHPQFRSHGVGTCEWDGAVWPFATSQTLAGLANVLRDYQQRYAGKGDYFDALVTYARSHRYRGKPYIGEYLDEQNGLWLKPDSDRSRYYNHSTFCDLVISGLVGLVPRHDDTVVVDPLIPAEAWDWFCLDNVLYHGRTLTILWDRTGEKYRKGSGLRVFADGVEIARAEELTRVTGVLP